MSFFEIVAASPTLQVDGDLLSTGIVGVMLIGVTIISGYVLNATSAIKKGWKDSEDNLKKNYEDILKAKEETLTAIIREKNNQLSSQKKLYEEMIDTRTQTIWEPLERKLKTAEKEIDRLVIIIQKLRKEAEEQRKQVRNLSEVEDKFARAIAYIDLVIEKLGENSLDIPRVPDLLKHELNHAVRISLTQGASAHITREEDDIVIEEDRPEEKNDD